MGNQFKTMSSDDFGKRVYKKINGWYSNEVQRLKDVKRIVEQREVIIGLLEKVQKVDVQPLLTFLDESGFYYRPSGHKRHHSSPGGLAEHSLGVYRIVKDWNDLEPGQRKKIPQKIVGLLRRCVGIKCDIFNDVMAEDDMVLASICHDLCKAKLFYFKGSKIKKHHLNDNRHSALSVKYLCELGINTPDCQEILLAVRTHMSLFSGKNNLDSTTRSRGLASMLAVTVWAADKTDARRHPYKPRHIRRLS